MPPLFANGIDSPQIWWEDIRVHVMALTFAFNLIAYAVIFFCGTRINRYFFGPTLTLDFQPREPFVVKTDTHNWKPNGIDYKDHFIRVRVGNTCQREATRCRGYLAKVKVFRDGQFHNDPGYNDLIPLKWSWSRMRNSHGDPVKPQEITLPHDVYDFLDIAAVYSGWPEKEGFVELQFDFMPEKYKKLIQPHMTYKLEIIVTANEAYYKTIQLKLTWDGTFDGLKAEKCD